MEQSFIQVLFTVLNLSINSGNFSHSYKKGKFKPLYRKVSLTQPCSYKPILCSPNIRSNETTNSQSKDHFSEFGKRIIH